MCAACETSIPQPIATIDHTNAPVSASQGSLQFNRPIAWQKLCLTRVARVYPQAVVTHGSGYSKHHSDDDTFDDGGSSSSIVFSTVI